ncbi:glycosyltransferase N-terminal domain-containing protein [Limibacillus halophilus]|uniref:3-deoxy-D-manno-octulosonic-acid transferase N-terminal domain-containing protein n=1 Tax=Limibacillus halophilus TaxID=1579333 RepID=A0A839SUU7_9PROT|nr:glycosyltransferase N-terminal domain-containing protein [Limibacillus halophilus]MBB3066587.1 hypothetical protein [Limibacillus halophilus]
MMHRGCKDIASRLGFPKPLDERAIWFFGASRDDFERAAPLIEGLSGRDTRLAVLLTVSPGGNGGQAATLSDWLETRFPSARIVPAPFGNALSLKLFLPRLRLRAAVFLEGPGRPDGRLVDGLRARGISLVGVAGPTTPGDAFPDSLKRLLERVFLIGATPAQARSDQNPPLEPLDAEACVARLQAIMARDLKASGSASRKGLAGKLLNLTERDQWNERLAWRMKRYRGLEELSGILGAPQTILCLGNGPSSEDPSLKDLSYDALFRVNHSWLERGFLAQPDVVFTGAKQSLRVVRQAIFGLQSRGAESRLVRERVFNPLLPASRFFHVGDTTPLLWDFDWEHLRPTNGACMLATAVALRPQRLIVAGVDLFQHPEGSYPGDKTTANAYSPGHSREKEQAFILQLLARYPGELTIVSKVLKEAWEEYRAQVDVTQAGRTI